MIQIIFILFTVSLTYGAKAKDSSPPLRSTSDVQEDQLKSVPKFDKKQPPSKRCHPFFPPPT